MQSVKSLALDLLKRWIMFVQRHCAVVVAAVAIAAGAAAVFAASNLGMNTDTKDMLSEELSWRQLDLDYEKHFPQNEDTMLVVVEAGTPDQALDGADRLYQAFRAEQARFKSVYYPNALSLFRDSALLFLDVDELQDLADSLAEIQPFLGRLTRDQTTRGLFGMLSDAVEAKEDGDDIDLASLVDQLNGALAAADDDANYRVSWHRLMSGEDEAPREVYREFILLQPDLNYDRLLPAEETIDWVRGKSEELGIEEDLGARVRLTGSLVLEHEELLSVTRGTVLAMILALCMVSVIMLIGLGSVRLVLMSIVTLLTGLILTAAFAAATVGELNLISVAFAVLYIGLGVDFAIHFCMRYRELLFHGNANANAIRDSSLNIGSALFLCACTTAIGFFAFIPTDYRGVAELGWISGFGMFISLAVTLTLLPALFALAPLKVSAPAAAKRIRPAWLQALMDFPFSHARLVRVLAALAAIALLGVISQLRFDYNVLNLQDPDNESVQTFQDLLADSDTSPWTGIVVADGPGDARRTAERMEALPVTDRALWIEDFIPEDQDAKLAIIEEMSLLLGFLPMQEGAPAISAGERLEALRAFAAQLESSTVPAGDPPLLRLQQGLRAFVERAAAMEPARRSAALASFEKALLASLPGRLETLRASLNADYITHDSMPEDFRRRWISPDGSHLVEIYPRENVRDNEAMRRFVEAVQDADPRVIGTPVINLEASDAVVLAFEEAFTSAFIVIAVLLVVLLSRKRDTLYVLAPLAMAAICTGGASVLLDIPLNFANIIALPLLLGIGVDSGIHILHRFRATLPGDEGLLATSTARAVVTSALTTMGGVGNLAFSSHVGTASMGKLLTIGIAATLICMLVLLPSLLVRTTRRPPD